MESVDKSRVANGDQRVLDVDPSANQPPSMESNWEKMANALQDELLELRVENRRLRRCMGGVGVLGRALKDTKAEVRRLRLAEDLSPVTDEHTTSTDKTRVTPKDKAERDTEDGTEDNTEGDSKAEDQVTSPTYEDDVVGNNEGNAACATAFEDEVVMTSSKDEGDLRGNSKDNAECVTAIEDEVVMTSPKDEDDVVGDREDDTEGKIKDMDLKGEFSKLEEVRTRQNDTHYNGSNGDTSKTGYKANENKGDTVNTVESPETSCYVEAMIASATASSKVLQYKEKTANAGSVATTADKGNVFTSTNLKHQDASSLRTQVQELKKVNIEWKKHWSRKKSEFIAELSKKDDTIGRLETQLNNARKEADTKANHYDQTLLTAKSRIEKMEDENKRLKKDVVKEQQRSQKVEMLNRTLIKQNLNMTDEITRLKQALEKKYQQHVQSASPEAAASFTKQSRSSDPKMDRNEVEFTQQTKLRTNVPMPLKAPEDEEKQDTRLTASKNVDAVSEKKTNPQENSSEVAAKSLSKEEMKEQVELLRQQNQMYESDFKKERADRQKVRNELQTLRHQLSKQRKHTQGQTKNSKDDAKSKAQGPPKHGVYSPPTQELLESESTPRRPDLNKLKTKPVRRTGMDVVKDGNKTICKVVDAQAIVIQTDTKGHGLQINLHPAESDAVRRKIGKQARCDPFICPRCQRVYAESDWESFEHHVTLCKYALIH